jgi:hypothetical protein
MYVQHVPSRRARLGGARPPHLQVVPASDTARRVIAPARAAREARDAALLAAIAYARDSAAFDELRARHAHAVEDAATRLGAAADLAAEIVDGTFAKLWERAWRLAAKGVHVRSWLLAIAREAAIERLCGEHRSAAPGGSTTSIR